MPILLKKELSNGGEVGIWQITEPVDYFEERLILHDSEQAEINSLKARKRLEWLASRYLLHLMSGRAARGACLKDQHGKPYLADSDYHISMSHSGDRVAVIASPSSVGVDIQKIVSKIHRIAGKYLTPLEHNRIDQRHWIEVLHVLWGAKESLYKAYGRRGLDFRQHIMTTPVVYDREEMHCKGTVAIADYRATFDIFATHIDDYILVYAIHED